MFATREQALDRASNLAPDWRGKLELLILQPSPFCNLDCDYCYLPNRNDRHRMEFGTLDALAWKIFRGGLPASKLSVIWHAGEPMAVPIAWYEQAFQRLAAYCTPDVHVRHHFQTNAVLIDARWCKFFKTNDVQIGVSIDGPDWLHDRHRHTRDGRGTHASVMRGIAALRVAQVPFHAICVLTRESLAHADELFDFFSELRPTCLCFNIEEIEGIHCRSSLAGIEGAVIDETFRSFMLRFMTRLRAIPGIFRVREFDTVLGALRHARFGHYRGNSQNEPGRILTIGWDGSWGTFSPELLGVNHPQIGSLNLGNVLFDPLPPLQHDTSYAKQCDEIARGVDRCRVECKYFDFCLGGAPANKLGEWGRFDVTETMFCRLTQKAVVDIVLDGLDRDLDQLGAECIIPGGL